MTETVKKIITLQQDLSIERPKVSKFQVGRSSLKVNKIQNQMSKKEKEKEKESQIQGNPEFFAVFVECKQNKVTPLSPLLYILHCGITVLVNAWHAQGPGF